MLQLLLAVICAALIYALCLALGLPSAVALIAAILTVLMLAVPGLRRP